MNKRATQFFWILLSANAVLRIIIGGFTSLGIDEAYYYSYTLYPEWSYFDHPPMVGLFGKISTIIFGVDSELGFRGLPLIVGTVNLILIFYTAKAIKNAMAGLIAALLYSASIYGSVISGSFILPDSPLNLFWLLSLFFIVKYYKTQCKNGYYLVLFGIAAGLAFLSKYSALFLWLGMILFLLREKQWKILKKPHWYLSMAFSAILMLPVFLWNYFNDFASITFHSNRISFGHLVFRFDYFAPELLGQIFYNNPINIAIIIACFVFYFRNKKSYSHEPLVRLLLFISVPVIILTFVVSCFNRTLPHWSGPGYTGLIIFAGTVLTEKYRGEKVNFRPLRLPVISNLFLLTIVIISLIQVNIGLFGNYSGTDENKLGKDDVSLDLYGWQQVKKKTFEYVNADLRNNKISPEFVLITHNWFPAGHIEFYIAGPLKRKLYVWGSKEKAHQYIEINKRRGEIQKKSDAYYITTSRYFCAPGENLISRFDTIEPRTVIEIARNSKPAYNVFLYRLKNAKADFSDFNNGN